MPGPYGRFTDYGEKFILRHLSSTILTNPPFACRLFSTTTDPEDDASPSLTECAFDGYTGVDFTFDIPALLSTDAPPTVDQYVIQSATVCRFAHTGDGVSDTDDTAYGYYITANSTGSGADAWLDEDAPIYYRFFDAPYTFQAFANPLYILPAWKLFGEEDIPACP